MKKTIKILLIIVLSLLTIILSSFIYYFGITKNIRLEENLLVNLDKTVSYYDQDNSLLFTQARENKVTEIDNIPLHVQNAFIAVEDKRFYKHKGVDFKGLSRAMLTNVKTLSFKEGGSTITQQLIKNTHFSNQKTIKRKLYEIKLAKKLEKKYSKKQILEKYLNTIYFGDNCYGIAEASERYFNKKPNDLTINEGAILAGIIKAPSIYSPIKNKEKALSRKNLVLKLMNEQGFINKNTLNENLMLDINTNEKQTNEKYYGYEYIAKKNFNEIIKNFPYWSGNLKVILTIDKHIQNCIEENINSYHENTNKSILILNKNSEIKGYFSTIGNVPRQIGSTIKPLISYAPAIEKNLVYSCTPILDEKTDFNGYSPSNYKDIYYGYVSVKDSLAKSLNVCSVKLLNYAGIDYAKSLINKTNIKLSENDNSLCLALGATEKGVTLIDLCSAYSVFLNQGDFYSEKIIEEISDEKGNVIYKSKNTNHQVFSEETTHIVNDMLENVVQGGTAKKLSFTNIPLCAKTGTVGNENGNSDAYCISFNSEYIMGSWFGNKDTLMPNSITGGTTPTIISSNIWNNIYKSKSPPPSYIKSEYILEEYIDKIEYETNHTIILANNLTPERYKLKSIFKKNFLPKSISNNFKSPKIESAEISLNNNQIEIKLCLTEYYNAYIYKKSYNDKILIADTALLNNKNLIIDKLIFPDKIYEYSIIPYYKYNNELILGEEIFLNKIKTPAVNVNDWWKNDL